MMHSNDGLYTTLNSTLHEIDKQIEEIKKSVLSSLPVHEKPDPSAVYKHRYSDGHPVLESMLLAKAECLHGMAALKAEESASQRARRAR